MLRRACEPYEQHSQRGREAVRPGYNNGLK
jgi:hypothetical protein